MIENKSTQQLSITGALEVHGWQHLDAVLLAALITESPLLLIGAHGTAKTLLVERISQALNLTFRHYNASLINYDDLVGIPMPEEGQDNLRFITTPGAIWDAQFVFFDEISRCRPDLQNKLFPIIHERRVVGMDLHNLRFRWAAMNPPSPDNPDLDMSLSDYYLGSEPLDPALTDRFPFIIPVPSWQDLAREDRRQLLALPSAFVAPSDEMHHVALHDVIAQACDRIEEIENQYKETLIDYVMAVMDLLDNAKLSQSPRRARMFTQNIIAIHAARQTLASDIEVELSDSAELALLYGLPQSATEVPPTPATLVALHRQAWEIASMLDDAVWGKILSEPDPLQRILLADGLDVSEDDLSRLITQALNVSASEVRQISLATAIFLRFSSYRCLNPAAWEPIARLAGRVLLPREVTSSLVTESPDMELWQTIEKWVHDKRAADEETSHLIVNYVLGGFPDLWRQYDWQESVQQFIEDLKFFGVEEF